MFTKCALCFYAHFLAGCLAKLEDHEFLPSESTVKELFVHDIMPVFYSVSLAWSCLFIEKSLNIS